MKLLRCSVANFGSYEKLDFDFSNLGLTLIHGATGSGKSTLQDVPAWILFATTAKDGAADDVRSWYSPDAVTYGSIEVELPDTVIKVVRIRGGGSKNDLYWTDSHSPTEHRGKDISDTQKLLEKRLGVSASLYLSCAYFHEFTPAASFFVTNAKNRRHILEKIANLDFPVQLAEKAIAERKAVKAEIRTVEEDLARAEGRLQELEKSLSSAREYLRSWDEKQVALIVELKSRHANFEKVKESQVQALQLRWNRFEEQRGKAVDSYLRQLEELDAALADEPPGAPLLICLACGAKDQKALERVNKHKAAKDASKVLLKQLEHENNSENPHTEALAQSKAQENQYDERIKQESEKTNPFGKQIEQYTRQLVEAKHSSTGSQHRLDSCNARSAGLSDLYELTSVLRGELLRRAVTEIEQRTNAYLQTYFEGEFRVSFQIEDADKVEVGITRNGYECVYAQLSKGQRGMLKLCFVLSVMQVASNQAGIHFDNVFLDEALDGLDAELKVKAYALFETLAQEHGSVMVIDHATELKQLFAKQFQVSLINDQSHIELSYE